MGGLGGISGQNQLESFSPGFILSADVALNIETGLGATHPESQHSGFHCRQTAFSLCSRVSALTEAMHASPEAKGSGFSERCDCGCVPGVCMAEWSR